MLDIQVKYGVSLSHFVKKESVSYNFLLKNVKNRSVKIEPIFPHWVKKESAVSKTFPGSNKIFASTHESHNAQDLPLGE